MSIVIALAQEQTEQILSRLRVIRKSEARVNRAVLLNFVPFEESDLAALLIEIEKVDGLLTLIARRIEAAEDVTEEIIANERSHLAMEAQALLGAA